MPFVNELLKGGAFLFMLHIVKAMLADSDWLSVLPSCV